MSTLLRKFSLARKALGELGPRQVWHYASYQALLRSGFYRWRTPPEKSVHSPVYPLNLDLIPLPDSTALLALFGGSVRREICALADEICSGQVRLFGGEPVALHLAPPGPLQHWTTYGSRVYNPGSCEYEDIKWTWEPARCAWGIQLGRAANWTGDVRYTTAFRGYLRQFCTANPPNLGPNWSSAQEIALRLISLCLAARLCSAIESPSQDETELLSSLVASHANRLPLTLSYARAQNNNHLLSEAAGLYTAGVVLPEHPQAARWRASGWEWFNRGLQKQISDEGSYIQNSANYHRLMLQLALWVNLLATSHGEKLPPATLDKLAASTRWLLDLADPDTGFVPNLGPNDGAYLIPLSGTPQLNYRPVLQASSLAFLGKPAFPPGAWDEMSHWLAPASARQVNLTVESTHPTGLLVLRPPDSSTWAYLRAARFKDRPGHADQLHLDLWWRGWNIACDAGTYLYNASPPWDNSLARTAVHNTLMIDGQEQMTLAGRFLWLDRAQAQVLEYQPQPMKGSIWAAAQHDGYRKLGLLHCRKVRWDESGWQVEDKVISRDAHPSTRDVSVSVHWLMPDCPWQIIQEDPPRLRLQVSDGWAEMTVGAVGGSEVVPGKSSLQLVRAGALLFGEGVVDPTWGWRSQIYSSKEPALSFRYSLQGMAPLHLITRWVFLPKTPEPGPLGAGPES